MIQWRFFQPQREKHHNNIQCVGIGDGRAVEHVAATEQSPQTRWRQNGTEVVVVLEQELYSGHDIQAKGQKQVGKQRHKWGQRTLHNAQMMSSHIIYLIINRCGIRATAYRSAYDNSHQWPAVLHVFHVQRCALRAARISRRHS